MYLTFSRSKSGIQDAQVTARPGDYNALWMDEFMRGLAGILSGLGFERVGRMVLESRVGNVVYRIEVDREEP